MVFSPFERMVAGRYLRARRQEGFISLIAVFSLMGICLGVATLIVVMAVMNGFRAELLDRVLGLNGHLNVFATRGLLTDYDDMKRRVEAVPGVLSATPSVEGQVLVTSDANAAGGLVRGVRPEELRSRVVVAENVRGSLEAFEGDRIAIGQRMAENFRVGVGDTLTLVSPKGNVTPFGTTPRMKAYEIAAIFETGYVEFDAGFVFMPLEAAQTFFRTGDAATFLEVMVADPDDLATQQALVSQVVRPDGRVINWQQTNAAFFNALQVERNVMFLILTLIIVVAAFNIISSLIMMVKDKGRDIAILRTMGASRGAVMRIFVMTGSFVGVVGTLLGVALGVAFALNIENIRQGLQWAFGWDLFNPTIYFLSQLPARLEWGEVGAVVAMALGLSFAATLYPSWRAARLDPVEALRYE